MNDILKNKYIKHDVSKYWLMKNDFKYNKTLSDDDIEIYTYRFPVHKYKNIPVLFCELSIDIKTGIVGINVYDENSYLYCPFYHVQYGNYNPLISSLNNKIIKRLNVFGIKKVYKSCK